MSTKENDIYYEDLHQKLEEIGGVIFDKESIEEALKKEEITQRMHGCSRTELGAKLDELREANAIALEADEVING